MQNGCLMAIYGCERDGKPPPTTFDVITAVYRIKVDDDGNFGYFLAQHVAVKRALEGLRRKGKVIGLIRRICRNDYVYDGRSQRVLCWMTERGARQWIQNSKQRAELVKALKAEMRKIDMQPE